MMTQERIEYFLKLPKGKITDEEFIELKIKYFKTDKTKWYRIIHENVKDYKWDVKKVKEFWELLRKYFHQAVKKDKILNFTGFVFPEFEDTTVLEDRNFWNANCLREFNYNVCFDESIFLGSAKFYEVHFKEGASFTNTRFKGKSDFEGVIFNKETNFQNTIFENKVSFFSTVFTNEIRFEYSVFYDKLDFTNVTVKSICEFRNIDCNKDADFSSSIFHQDFYLVESYFRGIASFKGITVAKTFDFDESITFKNVDFSSINFESKISFTQATFSENIDFNNTIFKGPAIFFKTVFAGDASFTKVSFLSRVEFTKSFFLNYVYFESDNFKNIIYDGINTEVDHAKLKYHRKFLYNQSAFAIFSKYEKLEAPKLIFVNIDFSETIEFSRFDMANIALTNCNLSRLNFNRCTWDNIIKGNRLRFNEEINFQDSENHYRQLKLNFSKKGNWEMAGYAYKSEMEMRKKRLWKNNEYHIWIFYAFYKYLGGYTQDFIRPVIALFGFFILFSLIYSTNYDFIDSTQMSIVASIPYLEVQEHVKFEGYWLIVKNIQFILSVTLLSFFVLALRKRFKL